MSLSLTFFTLVDPRGGKTPCTCLQQLLVGSGQQQEPRSAGPPSSEVLVRRNPRGSGVHALEHFFNVNEATPRDARWN